MKQLEERILADGRAVDDSILKVDSFINHQVDMELMNAIGEEFCNYYKDKGVTKIVTIESSGIAPAAMVALKMNLPLIILKKKESKILDEDFIQTEVTSYTKANPYNLTLACKFINENDHCVIIDDFLANGEAATGAIRLLRKLHATIAGVGILVEKSYQPGRKKLEEAGIDVFSLARIKKLDTGIIEFVEE